MGDRGDRQGCRSDDDSKILAAETLRSGASKRAEGSDEKSIPMIWRVFGGTLLSIAALVAITLYQQLSNRIENNNDALSRKVESISDNLVKQQDFSNAKKALFELIQTNRKETADGDKELRQRCVSLEVQLKNSEDKTKEMAGQIAHLNEALASYAGLKEIATRLEQQFRESKEERMHLVQDIQQVRERLASVEGKAAASSKKSTEGE
jgi:chromosome segregation ATPase